MEEEVKEPKTEEIVPKTKKKATPKLMSAQSVGSFLGLDPTLLFVINKKFKANDKKTLDEWKVIFKAEKIIKK